MKTNTNTWALRPIFLSAGFAVLLMLLSNVQAAVTSIAPFSGNVSETWESHNDFITGPYYVMNPASIFSGNASIANSRMLIYLTYSGNLDTSFGLGSSGLARVSDGVKGLGINGSDQITTITFENPVVDFGAYWGAATSSSTPATISLNFSDGSVANFDYISPIQGILEWHGWHFSAGITSLSYSGDYVVIDGLQANLVPEPTTTSIALLGVGLMFLIRRNFRLTMRCSEPGVSVAVAILASRGPGR